MSFFIARLIHNVFLFLSVSYQGHSNGGKMIQTDYKWHPQKQSNYRYLESLPNILQKKYGLLRDLDKSLQEIQRQNEQRCEQEIEEIKRVKGGSIVTDNSVVRFSDEALDEQKHSVRIADEKVALAVQAYDLVDAHIQQLDQYLKKFDEELRRERETAAAAALPSSSVDGSAKSGRIAEGGRGGRKNWLRCLDKLHNWLLAF
ncbi:PHD finger protein ING1 isoform X2 [Mercurialis annua]|uniref:PHD finger protein ING1 isoform X2 n=1 Tax=Mercurialis annua TaxID=3986 RepID=UPI00215ED1DF|nr:PHD finger protein ING1 isoform X2 [Mercurialis annua]